MQPCQTTRPVTKFGTLSIHFVAISPFEKISPRSTITMELAPMKLNLWGMAES